MKPEIKRTLILDIQDLAERIEELFGPYLPKYKEGIYRLNESTPIFVPGVTYWLGDTNETNTGMVVGGANVCYHLYSPTNSLEKIFNQKGTVDVIINFNEPNEILITKGSLIGASYKPSYPAYGENLALDILYNEVDIRLKYKKVAKHTLESIISGYLDGGPDNRAILKDNKATQKMIAEIFEMVRPIANVVDSFMGGKTWVIHELMDTGIRNNYIYKLDQTIDYRIADWERRMKNGDWK